MQRAGLHPIDVWLRYASLGGNASAADIERYIVRDSCPNDHEHNLLAQAINEAFLEQGGDHPVAYRYPLGPGPTG
jgi:hypothetical protein